MEKTAILETTIFGRVKPHIYAFKTGTIPNYLKVGDTYRPVHIRLNEWAKKYELLEEVYRKEAIVDENTFFRDYAIHQYFEDTLGLHRLCREEINSDIYYSNEFFKDATKEHIETAIEDICNNFTNGGTLYHYYRFDESPIPIKLHYERGAEEYKPREEQKNTVKKFRAAIAAGRKNLLMYAVMRFGKSFTAMLCAKAIDAKLVVVLCGKTSVADEWKRNVEIPKNFEGYYFYTYKDLDDCPNLISRERAAGKKMVLFLTLQDLAGDNIKERHKELFESEIDLTIIDETHFGARAPKYGRVLNDELGIKANLKEHQDESDIEELGNSLKHFKTKIKLHLSGTPYRILMGSEFEAEDIIAFYQFSDIVKAQHKWDDEYLKENGEEGDYEEWDNPYYGFPQMIRFAFNPSKSARKLIKDLREKGKTCALSALFEPMSIGKDKNGLYKKFKHEQEVLELFESIDGTNVDDELFDFLNYDRIREGKMCRHIVCVLPFRASCDALQKLIEDHKFNRLSEYTILNIAGHDCPKSLIVPEMVKDTISKLEKQDKKTITLTVNKMLTGSTVEQWDTILFFKDTASPQEYDQAIFRIQSPYVKKIIVEGEKEIKFDMKPQTLLVDFDIDRLFRLQALKAQISNTNIDKKGNAELEHRMSEELKISPVIVLNKDRFKKVEPADIMEAISEYSRNRSVADEAAEIPVDMRLMTDFVIKAEIDKQGMISSKEGLSVDPHRGKKDEDDNYNFGNDDEDDTNSEEKRDSSKKIKESPEEQFRRRFATYYSRILFYTFLTKTLITNLDELIESIDKNEDNIRIAKNLNLSKEFLVYLRSVMDGNKLGVLEFKIRNLNRLTADADLQPLDKAKIAMRRFSRLSESEITTPENIAKDMVALLPDDCSAENHFLDIAAKQGEFAIALVERFGEVAKKSIWSIPTSGAAYEFTRKIYEFLGMPIENIFADFTSYDLIGENNQEIIKRLTDMKFDAIIGNPPYQIGKIDTSDDPIYNLFYDVAFRISKRVSLITPARFLFNAGKTPKEWNEKMLNDAHFKVLWYNSKSSDVFPDVDIKGGIAIGYRDAQEQYGGVHVYTAYPQLNTLVKKVSDYGYTPISEIFYAQNKFNLEALYADYPNYRTRIGSNGRERRLTTSIFALTELFSEQQTDDDICVLGLIKNQRTYRYLKRKYIEEGGNLDFYKVIVPKSNGTGAIGEVEKTPLIGDPVIGEPHTGVTQSFITFGKFKTKDEVEAAHKYIRSKFARTLLGVLKVTQHNSKEVWRYVPLQDFTANSDIDWSKSITEIDAQLYAKYGLSSDEIAFIDSMIKPM